MPINTNLNLTAQQIKSPDLANVLTAIDASGDRQRQHDDQMAQRQRHHDLAMQQDKQRYRGNQAALDRNAEATKTKDRQKTARTAVRWGAGAASLLAAGIMAPSIIHAVSPEPGDIDIDNTGNCYIVAVTPTVDKATGATVMQRVDIPGVTDGTRGLDVNELIGQAQNGSNITIHDGDQTYQEYVVLQNEAGEWIPVKQTKDGEWVQSSEGFSCSPKVR